jgi:Histidine kinase
VSSRPRAAVRDLWPRLLVSPVLGALLATISGLIDFRRHSAGSLAASYAYFAVVAFVIWTGNRELYIRLPRREDWLQRPYRRLAALLASILLFTVPAAALLIWVWRRVTGDPGMNAYAFQLVLAGIVTAAVAITHVYETVFLLADWESDRLRSARTEKARLEAELAVLGREVDPHFLFNHLNVLAHLVEARSPAALPFITALSGTYRYVLDSRGTPLVRLAEELESLRRHETLARLRFGPGISMRVDVDEAAAASLRLPPVTLAELFQNAVKHNVTGPESPLAIHVRVENGTLVFGNDIRRRSQPEPSTGIGLHNLSRRFRLATGREIAWGLEGDRFVVRLPLLADAISAAPPSGPSPGSSSGS